MFLISVAEQQITPISTGNFTVSQSPRIKNLDKAYERWFASDLQHAKSCLKNSNVGVILKNM